MNRLDGTYIYKRSFIKLPIKLLSVSFLAIASVVNVGCGGSDSDDGLLPTDPDPVASMPPEATPSSSPPPTPTPTPAPTQPAEPETFRIVDIDLANGALNVNWTDADADSYRLLYWRESEAPIEHTTNQLDFSAAAPAAGTYTFIVEAYDALGNSVFSAPDFVEVTR